MDVDAPVAHDDGLASRLSRTTQTTQSLPWVEKYRPDALSELVSQGDIVSTRACKCAARRGARAGGVCFCGSRAGQAPGARRVRRARPRPFCLARVRSQ